MKILFLGTGTSTGVPVIGCGCSVCQSSDSRDKRLRSSVLMTTTTTRLLIDAGPDLRQQALRHDITALDAVLYTHPHLDHVSGFDELRSFCWHDKDARLPLYAYPSTMQQLRNMYGWAFSTANTYAGYIRPEPREHDGKTPFLIGDIEVTPVAVEHATVDTFGYVLRDQSGQGASFGYIPDVKHIPDSSLAALRGLDILALDALGEKPHRSHLHLEATLSTIAELAPAKSYLTHIGHRYSYEELEGITPNGVRSAYDGLEIEI